MPDKDKASAKGVSRRAFARGVAIAAASAVVLPGRTEAQQAPPPTSSAPVGTPEKKSPEAPAEAKKLSPAAQGELDSKFKRVMDTYGARLSPDLKEEVQRQLNDQVKALETIRAAGVDNSVQPATVLKITGKA